MGIRNFVKAISPGFLIGPGTPGAPLPATAGYAERLMYSLALGADVVLEKTSEAIAMRSPGLGDASSLPYSGAERMIARGPYETDVSYAARLVVWLDSWSHAGQARGVVSALAGYLTPVGPLVGSWLEGSGETITDIVFDGDPWDTVPMTIHDALAASDWDGHLYPKRRFVAIDAWGTASGITWAPSTSVWGVAGTWGDRTRSWGLDIASSVAADLRSIVEMWKGGGTRYPWIVIRITDACAVPPTTGDWGNWSKTDLSGVRPVRIPSRNANGRYIDGVMS